MIARKDIDATYILHISIARHNTQRVHTYNAKKEDERQSARHSIFDA